MWINRQFPHVIVNLHPSIACISLDPYHSTPYLPLQVTTIRQLFRVNLTAYAEALCRCDERLRFRLLYIVG
jgi:hypothetical protein